MTGGRKDEIPPEDTGRSAEVDRLALSERVPEWLRVDGERARTVIRGDEDAITEYERAAAELGLPSTDEVCYHMDQDWKQ